MYRTHTCGELNKNNLSQTVTLAGWVFRIRHLSKKTFVDLRDRYGVTQLLFSEETNLELYNKIKDLGREFVIQVTGKVIERSSKNPEIPTGEIEIEASEFNILNKAIVPPFILEDETDGGEDLRMKYRYLDIRRNAVKKNLLLRHQMAKETRKYLDAQNFVEVETPVLIKSTPEGARDFVVPSRMNPGQFYALPQSPQTFKQLLMVAGLDKYYQIVKCFRDEDLRADRQPEFTQIDCEMSFVEQEDILNMFEGLTRHLFKTVKGVDLAEFPRMTYAEAMKYYGCDKPDTRFEMKFVEITDIAKGKNFPVFDSSELIVGICAKGCSEYSRKQLDALVDFVKRPQVGAKGLVYVKYGTDGVLKSSVDKFYAQEDLKKWADAMGAQQGDLLLVLSGEADKTRKQLSELRLEMGTQLGLRDPNVFKTLWVLDFPLLEWNEETNRFFAMHHPFTSPKLEDVSLLDTDPGRVRANAYDLVINGVEIGGGSIRIHDRKLQKRMFECLGFTDEEAQHQFGFLMNAFEFGAPPHGGLALGFDRLCSMFGGSSSIKDYIAFPKNNAGRDMMIDTPSSISDAQLKELNIHLSPALSEGEGVKF